ncbi:33 kDa ribonucleoprotein, chloroplastic isoform X2 [Manihot esculenta]|uniref:Uncharacterized protein n=1 Tax=Manihot esculenta TaxID=3983 RepID=A0ACB7IFL6_MANES|nr:33 kDa ribonucleoprotein, chloroplastic isoform X2 [Manihot esculenta]KAG8663688.1 hypothetical protein MANES_01G239700v8 [Manihot esculenta]
MAAIPLVPSLPSSIRTTSSASLSLHHSVKFQCSKISCLLRPYSRDFILSSFAAAAPRWPPNKGRSFFSLLAVVDEESVVAEEIDRNESYNDLLGRELKKQPRPCELYVCNLPRSCDISELAEMFKPFGTVISVEEVGGREMRVKFSVDMSSSNRSPEALNSAPIKDVVYESPYKLYIGNISWSVKPEELRNQFSQFGIVVSARVLYDRKAGKNRAYGFLSFSSAADRDAALSLNGREFRGRILVVRKGVERDN